MRKNENSYIMSKSTYKKLGTILEHLIDTINPYFYELRVSTMTQPMCVVIRIVPIPNQANMFPLPVWELVWNSYFNSKIYIDPVLLMPNAEW